MSINGDESESLTAAFLERNWFSNSVQKLPSISRSSKHLSAGGRFSLGSLVMYSSFSLPFTILKNNITDDYLTFPSQICQENSNKNAILTPKSLGTYPCILLLPKYPQFACHIIEHYHNHVYQNFGKHFSRQCHSRHR